MVPSLLESMNIEDWFRLGFGLRLLLARAENNSGCIIKTITKRYD
jgi:hypothetical protein